MKKMGIEAIYRRPNTSKPAPGHKIYPYLLRKLAVTRPNQVWAMDLTYIPMARGLYLCAVVDWFGQWVSSLAIIDRDGRLLYRSGRGSAEAAMESRTYSTPTRDRSSHPSTAAKQKKAEIAISMDGKGAWRDNVFVERRRFDQAEEVCTHAAADRPGARDRSLSELLQYSTSHSSLDGRRRIRLTSTRWHR